MSRLEFNRAADRHCFGLLKETRRCVRRPNFGDQLCYTCTSRNTIEPPESRVPDQRILIAAAEHANAEVPQAVSPDTPPGVLDALAKAKPLSLGLMVASNPSVAESTLRWLINHFAATADVQLVSWPVLKAVYDGWSQEMIAGHLRFNLLAFAAANPACGESFLHELLDAYQLTAANLVAHNSNLPVSVLQALLDQPDRMQPHAELALVRHAAMTKERLMHGVLKFSVDTLPAILQQPAADADVATAVWGRETDARNAILEHHPHFVTPEMLAGAESREWLHASLAESPAAPPDMLERLADSSSMGVRLRVAANPNTPQHILDSWVSQIVAAEPENLKWHRRDDLRVALLCNDALSERSIKELVRTLSGNEMRRCAERWKTSATALRQLHRFGDGHLYVNAAIASNPHAPQDLIEELARSEHYVERLRVTCNKSAPEYLLTLLAFDPVSEVRQSAAEKLQARAQRSAA